MMKKVFFAFAVVAALGSVSSCTKNTCSGGTFDGMTFDEYKETTGGVGTQATFKTTCETGGGKLK